ncbi:hypothetical protein CWN49_12480 [Klebsiella michiganensis]|uniref:Cupin fold metalloprotein WbuC cupin domain-containing protein n=1 Tax=Klebsiella michiganensis TaxID=1134687 RepID=A0A2J5PW52_9ENTR|nr:hypothetical protein CWN49_12480 [Klebsiella michiganensis]
MKQMTLSDLRQQSEQAAASPRLRAHRNFHPDLSDPVQRLAVAMEPGTWHAVLSMDKGGVIFEVKYGGYQPVSEQDAAPWAPAENAPGTAELMKWYARAQVGDGGFTL